MIHFRFWAFLAVVPLVISCIFHSPGYYEYVGHRDYILASSEHSEQIKERIKAFPTSGTRKAWEKEGYIDSQDLAARVKFVRDYPQAPVERSIALLDREITLYDVITNSDEVGKLLKQRGIKEKTEERKARYISNHPELLDWQKQHIRESRYQIGMTTDMIRASIGEPNNINRTVTHYGTSEQWVYDRYGVYLYFDNGILTAYQN